jgi:hypothetical protein
MGLSGGETSCEISELLLEVTAKAMLGNDFDAFARCFHLPHVIETPDRKTVLKSTAALRAVFDTVVADYANRGVTRLIRVCEVSEFRGPFRIEATHITHMMAGNLRVADPFPCFSVLEFIEDRWQCTSSQYAVDRRTTVGRALDARARDLGNMTGDQDKVN